MKKIILSAISGAALLASCNGGESSDSNTLAFNGLNNQSDSLSYFLGSNSAKSLAAGNMQALISTGSFMKGYKDGEAGDSILVGQEFIPRIQKISEAQRTAELTPIKLTNNISFSGLKTKKDSVSYFIGADIHRGLQSFGMDVYFQDHAFLQGFIDQTNGDSLILSDNDGAAIANAIQQEKQAEKDKEQAAQFEDKIAADVAYLNGISEKEGVITLPSGLRYEILKAGNGPKPKATDVVSTHYHGTLIDGTVFDSSVERGEPAQFPVNRVIPAWIEALQLMPVGSKWKLYAPYQLAYGSQSPSAKIAPFSTLIFEVELLDIVSQ